MLPEPRHIGGRCVLKKGQNRIKDSSGRTGFLLSLPYWVYFAFFMAWPLIFSLVLVFHEWDIYTPMRWVGLGNFVRLFQDNLFWQAILNTLYFLVIHIPLQIGKLNKKG